MKMKSSSSSSSSLSLASKTQTFGCISLFLHRFLCSGTSSTNPSDQTTESSFESPDFSSEPHRARGDELGAVARLMGLDSVPVIDKTRVVSRSRSVDYSKKDDDEIQGKHRRVKSSLEYVELEDDKFFILSFEKDNCEKAFGELKQLGTRKCKKRRETRENRTHEEGKENNINAMNVSPERERLEIRELKQRRQQERKNRRKIKLRQKIEKENWIKSYGRSRDGDLVNYGVTTIKEEVEECESCDESSPVSVLDYDWFSSVRATPLPGSSSRRQLSSELESSKLSETVQEEHITSTRSRLNIQHSSYQEMWQMICKLTVSDIEGSNWVHGKASKLEDLEGIVSDDIVSNILDQLLEETITTLSLTSQM